MSIPSHEVARGEPVSRADVDYLETLASGLLFETGTTTVACQAYAYPSPDDLGFAMFNTQHFSTRESGQTESAVSLTLQRNDTDEPLFIVTYGSDKALLRLDYPDGQDLTEVVSMLEALMLSGRVDPLDVGLLGLVRCLAFEKINGVPLIEDDRLLPTPHGQSSPVFVADVMRAQVRMKARGTVITRSWDNGTPKRAADVFISDYRTRGQVVTDMPIPDIQIQVIKGGVLYTYLRFPTDERLLDEERIRYDEDYTSDDASQPGTLGGSPESSVVGRIYKHELARFVTALTGLHMQYSRN